MDAAVSYDIWGYAFSKPNTDLAAGHLLYGMGVALRPALQRPQPRRAHQVSRLHRPPRPAHVRLLRAQARPRLRLLAEPHVHPHGRPRDRRLRRLRRSSRSRALGRALPRHLRPRPRHLLAGRLLLRGLRVLDLRHAVDHPLPRRAQARHRRRPLRPARPPSHASLRRARAAARRAVDVRLRRRLRRPHHARQNTATTTSAPTPTDTSSPTTTSSTTSPRAFTRPKFKASPTG